MKDKQKKHKYAKYLDKFHILYYDSRVMMNTNFLGRRTPTCPLDMWILQEIIHQKGPDVIIETGTYYGGGTLYFATICDAIGRGEIISIDIKSPLGGLPEHKRITYLLGSSTAPTVIKEIKSRIKDKTIMVILDSDHHADHVLKELKIYSELVSLEHYLIVCDTNISGHPAHEGIKRGPMEALKKFLKNNKNFEIDKERQKFGMTFHPNGYLKKKY